MKRDSTSGTVWMRSNASSVGTSKRFHDSTNTTTSVASTAGQVAGRKIRQVAPASEQPSSAAASSSSRGSSATNPASTHSASGSPSPATTTASAAGESNTPSAFASSANAAPYANGGISDT